MRPNLGLGWDRSTGEFEQFFHRGIVEVIHSRASFLGCAEPGDRLLDARLKPSERR